MASFVPYYLRILDARGQVVESFPSAPLAQLIPLVAARAADFDTYQTVWRVLKQTGGLYARPFLSIPEPAGRGRRKRPALPIIVHVVSAPLFHVGENPAQ
jgi:hypothetical protein